MARFPMITRTVKMTKAQVLCINTDSEMASVETLTLARTFKDEKHALIAANAALVGTPFRAVSIKSSEVVECILGMTEQDFIKHAHPVTRGSAATEEAQEPTADEQEG